MSSAIPEIFFVRPAHPVLRRLAFYWTELIGDIHNPSRGARRFTSQDAPSKKQIRGKHIVHELSQPAEAHIEHMMLPTKEANLHSQALHLALRQLSPIDLPDIIVSADLADSDRDSHSRYRLAFVRRTVLDALTSHYTNLGAQSVRFVVQTIDRELPVYTVQQRREVRSRRIKGIAIAALAALIPLLAIGWSDQQLESELAALQTEETQLRRQIIDGINADKQQQKIQATLAARPAERRPGRILDEIAAITRTTPAGAWWQRFTWQINSMQITVRSTTDILSIVSDMNERQDDYLVRLASDVTSSTSGETVRLVLTKTMDAEE